MPGRDGQVILDSCTPPAGTMRDWLDAHAYERGDELSHLFPDGGAPLTWRDVRDSAAEVASRLTALGIAERESIALVLPNGKAAVICLFGVLYGGLRVTPINLVAATEAICHALEHSRARFAFVGRDQTELWEKAKTESGITANPVDGAISWPEEADAPLHPLGTDDDALLVYSSGTTGRPKGVVHSHASLLSGGWTTSVAHQLTPADRAICILPINHINGLCVTVMGPLVSGGSVAICNRFSASRFWDQCEAAEATSFSAVPTIISHLLHGEQAPAQQSCRRLRFRPRLRDASACQSSRRWG